MLTTDAERQMLAVAEITEVVQPLFTVEPLMPSHTQLVMYARVYPTLGSSSQHIKTISSH